jgi:AbrB family looped-hinge helix DNA binding protein
MYTVTATQKGQIVIPSKIRKKLHIKKGTKLYIQEEGMHMIIKPANREYIKSLVGMYGEGGNHAEAFIKERRADDAAFMKKVEKWLE